MGECIGRTGKPPEDQCQTTLGLVSGGDAFCIRKPDHDGLHRFCLHGEDVRDLDRLVDSGPSPVTATLRFDLESHEGERRLRECLDAGEAREAVREFNKWLRDTIKWGCDDNPARADHLQEARDKLYMEFHQCGVTVDE